MSVDEAATETCNQSTPLHKKEAGNPSTYVAEVRRTEIKK